MVHGALPGGGSRALAELIDKHGEAIEATLAGFGVDLYDVIRGDVPPTKVFRLLKWSPPDSPWRASVNGGIDRLGWTGGAAPVVADLFDALVAVNTPKGKEPVKHPRGGKGRKAASNLGQVFTNMKSKGRGHG